MTPTAEHPAQHAAIRAAAEAANLGVATHRKTGRHHQYPYVPVVRHTEGGLHGYGYDEQLLGRAYPTKDEAVAHAQAAINQRRAHLGGQLGLVNMRALREQHGLPRELTEVQA